MQSLLLVAVGGGAGLVTASLTYLATRQRDAPTIEIARQTASVASAKLVSEMWAEYSATLKKTMDEQVDKANTRIDALEAEVVALQAEVDSLKKRLLAEGGGGDA